MKAEGQQKKGYLLKNTQKGNYAKMYITFKSVFKYIKLLS